MRYKEYLNKKPIGGLCLCNFGGLVVLDIINGIDDYIVSAFDFGNGNENISKSKVQYTNLGRAYFRKYNKRYYLDEIIRY